MILLRGYVCRLDDPPQFRPASEQCDACKPVVVISREDFAMDPGLQADARCVAEMASRLYVSKWDFNEAGSVKQAVSILRLAREAVKEKG